MNHKVRIIKRIDREKPELDRPQQPSANPTREVTTTIKVWVSEFKRRRRANEDRARIGEQLMNNAESVG
jgi:hypothetical protein